MKVPLGALSRAVILNPVYFAALSLVLLTTLAGDVSHADDEKVIRHQSPFRDCAQCPTMVIIDQGVYRLGDRASAGGGDEAPVYWVDLFSARAVSQTEVTWGQWEACVIAGACAAPHLPELAQDRDLPVRGVHWQDVQDYLLWLRAVTRAPYRLPSESEWEVAARAGNTNAWPWRDQASEACRFGNIRDRAAKKAMPQGKAAKCDDGQAAVSDVGQYEANEYQAFDFIGNVWEWTADCWIDHHRARASDGGPHRNVNCFQRTIRGGSFRTPPRVARFSVRKPMEETAFADDVGFRVALTLNQRNAVELPQ